MINKDLLIHFPGWINDVKLHPDDYYMVMTDDMDSFYSCRFLNKNLGLKIGGFYDFKTGLYLTNDVAMSNKRPIYVDASCVKDGVMCFDNHRTVIRNHMAVNPNLTLNQLNENTYFKKYCGSTLMLVVALYGDLDKLSDIEKEFMIAMDGFFIGYYGKNGAFKDINIYWIDLLGLKDILLPVLQKHDSNYFADLTENWQLKEKIYIDNDRLFTYKDILPHDQFSLVMPAHQSYFKKEEIAEIALKNDKIFMASETYKNCYMASILD